MGQQEVVEMDPNQLLEEPHSLMQSVQLKKEALTAAYEEQSTQITTIRQIIANCEAERQARLQQLKALRNQPSQPTAFGEFVQGLGDTMIQRGFS
jgi:hypothetical protein